MDMRIAKVVYNNSEHSDITYTYYSYDAQGNVMATYSRKVKYSPLKNDTYNYRFEDSYRLLENHIYGSSRLGVENNDLAIKTRVSYAQVSSYNVETGLLNGLGVLEVITPNTATIVYPFDYTNRTVGDKNYELSNHLGNVLSVVTDRKIGESTIYQNQFNTTIDNFVTSNGTPLVLGPTAQSSTRLEVTSIGSNQTVSRSITTEVGNTYRITVDLSLLSSGNIGVFAYNGTTQLASTTATLDGLTTLQFVATSTTTRIVLSNMTATTRTFWVNDILVYNTKILNYTADVVQYTDYSPYGVELDQRNSVGNTYRNGFQGQERDNEIKGEGNSLNYQYRMHDPRIGRFFAVDPLTHQYSHYTPYSFSGNKVIAYRELEGMEEKDMMYWFDPGLISFRKQNSYEVNKNLRKQFDKGFQMGVAAGAVLAFDVFVTKGWLSRSLFLAAVGQNMNAHDRYYDALAKGDKVGMANAKAEIEETGMAIALGILGEIAGPALNYAKGMIKEGWTLTQIKNFKYNVETFGEDVAIKYSKGEISTRDEAILIASQEVKVGTKVSKQKMIGKQHLNSDTKSGMKSYEDAQTVLDNYNAGKLEVVGVNVKNGQITVRDNSVTGLHRTNGGETVQESHIFVIKGQGTSVTVFPKNPNTN